MKLLVDSNRGKSCCIYGAAGVGKTSIFSTLPDHALPCLIFDTEVKVRSLIERIDPSRKEYYFLADYNPKQPENLQKAMKILSAKPEEIKTVIVDSLTSWEHHMLWDACTQAGRAFPNWDQRDFVSMRLRQLLQQELGSFLNAGLNLFCTAIHQVTKKGDQDGEVVPRLGGMVPLEIPALFCDVLYMDINQKNQERFLLTERSELGGIVHNARHEKMDLPKIIKPDLSLLW